MNCPQINTTTTVSSPSIESSQPLDSNKDSAILCGQCGIRGHHSYRCSTTKESNDETSDTSEVKSSEEECPICYESLNNKFSLTTDCGHKFCLDCFKKTVEIKSSCPLCRKEVPESILRISKSNTPQPSQPPQPSSRVIQARRNFADISSFRFPSVLSRTMRVQNRTNNTLNIFKANNEGSESRIVNFNLKPGEIREITTSRQDSKLIPGIGQIITFSPFLCTRCSQQDNFVNIFCKHNNTTRTRVDRTLVPGSPKVNFIDSNKTYLIFEDHVQIV